MTKAEIINALYEIKKTCREAEGCFDCIFHKIDAEGLPSCPFVNVFVKDIPWENMKMRVDPIDWDLKELED